MWRLQLKKKIKLIEISVVTVYYINSFQTCRYLSLALASLNVCRGILYQVNPALVLQMMPRQNEYVN